MTLDFLAADTPLVKSFALVAGETTKTPYPMVRDFTSHRLPCSSITELHAALIKGAANHWCLLKGTLDRQLINESRAGHTNPADATQILVLDLDGLKGYDSINAVLKVLGLHKFQHIIQWSASSHISATSESGLSAHVFFWLNAPVSPQLIKPWIQNANLTHFATSITLTKSGAALHWPIDPSVMDNSKLIYIAPPVLHGLTSCLKGESITLCNSAGLPAVPSSFFSVNPQAVAKARLDALNTLRKTAGYAAIRDSQLKTSNGQLYLSKPGAATVTDVRSERGFVYLNLNGGDSWGYYHPEDNPEYVYNFKGEPIYKTEELCPEYWAHCNKRDPQRPQSKVRYFICRDFRTDRLYNGIYYVDENRLEMARAANEGRLKGFMKQHGQPVPDFVPDFTIEYNPHNPVKFSFEDRYINTYEPGPFEGKKHKSVSVAPPTIMRVIESAVGREATYWHFINWFADIVQNKVKTGTAWAWQGTEGTGKGVLFHNIIRPILGASNVAYITSRELESAYNGYMEHALVVFGDEMQISALKGSIGLSANLRAFITEPEVAIRRMYSEAYPAKNFSNFILASNMPDPVIIPEGDRRFHVGDFQGTKLALSTEDLQAIEKELEDFYHFLMGVKVDQNKTREILQSEDRDRLVNMSMTAADSMASSLLNGNLEDLVDNMPQRALQPHETAYEVLVKDILKLGLQETKLTRDELYTIFRYRAGVVPDSPNKFTSFLRHHRIHTTKIWKNNRSFWGIHVVWTQTPEWMAETYAVLTKPEAPRLVKMAGRAKT